MSIPAEVSNQVGVLASFYVILIWRKLIFVMIKVPLHNESKLSSYLLVCHAAVGRSGQSLVLNVKVVGDVFFYFQPRSISAMFLYVAPSDGRTLLYYQPVEVSLGSTLRI